MDGQGLGSFLAPRLLGGTVGNTTSLLVVVDWDGKQAGLDVGPPRKMSRARKPRVLRVFGIKNQWPGVATAP